MHNDCNLVTQSVSDVACYRRASVMSMITESKKNKKTKKHNKQFYSYFKADYETMRQYARSKNWDS